MSEAIIKKNGTDYPLQTMPLHYPADRVYLDGDTSKTVQNPTFTEASTRANIASGESFATILGKIKKWFTDLPSMFVSKSGDTMTGTLQLGNASVRGELRIMGNDKTHYGRFYNTSGAPLSDNRNYFLPNKSGIIAVTDDITSDAPVKIAEAAANQTFAQQLTSLQSAWAGLSDKQKARSYLTYQNTYRLTLVCLTASNYSASYIEGGSNFTSTFLSINGATAHSYSALSNAYYNLTNLNDQWKIELWA